jgi:hypothetical protein
MGVMRNGYTDADMNDDFSQWLEKYSAVEVFSFEDERGREIAKSRPEFVWLESMYEKTYLIPLGSMTKESIELSIADTNGRWENRRFYLCEKPYPQRDSGSEDWVLIEGLFACESCEPGPDEEGDPDCQSCTGEGWLWLSVYDEDAREELEELLEESGIEFPKGFPSER